MWGKDDGSYDSLTSWDESPDFMKNKRGQRSPYKNKRGQRSPPKREKEKKIKKKKWEKREKGQCYYPFSTLVLQSSTMIFMIESLLYCHFHILVGIFIIELGLYIPMMGFLKCPRSSWASKLDAHPLSFQFELSYTYSSSASVACQSLLTCIDIDWWASP